MYCDDLAHKYNIKNYSFNDKQFTYNKIRHKLRDDRNQKHKLSEQHKLYGVIFTISR